MGKGEPLNAVYQGPSPFHKNSSNFSYHWSLNGHCIMSPVRTKAEMCSVLSSPLPTPQEKGVALLSLLLNRSFYSLTFMRSAWSRSLHWTELGSNASSVYQQNETGEPRKQPPNPSTTLKPHSTHSILKPYILNILKLNEISSFGKNNYLSPKSSLHFTTLG